MTPFQPHLRTQPAAGTEPLRPHHLTRYPQLDPHPPRQLAVLAVASEHQEFITFVWEGGAFPYTPKAGPWLKAKPLDAGNICAKDDLHRRGIGVVK